MNYRWKKTWVAASVVAVAVSAAGVAGVAAAGTADRDDPPLAWYEGGNATVPDANKTTVPLKLYDAAGAVVTSGSTTTPLATYVAADTSVRAGDDYASLFVHLPQKAVAQAAWSGVQATGTDKFAGTGAVTAPASLSGKPFVRTAGGYTLADAAAALPNDETAADSFVGVYELRLRTSSATAGVAGQYAATYLKVTGTTWKVTDAPVLGGDAPDPDPVATTTTPTWPSRITYGTATKVDVAVTAASGDAKPTGTVSLVYGTKTLRTATLSASATASLAIARTDLPPGSRSLRVVYSGATGTFVASQSAARTFAVAKARTGTPTFRATKAPTARAAGKAAVTVPTASGLTKATGKGTITLKRGSYVKRVAVTVAAGKGTATLPKVPAGTYTVSFAYPGNAYYLASVSKTSRLVVKSR